MVRGKCYTRTERAQGVTDKQRAVAVMVPIFPHLKRSGCRRLLHTEDPSLLQREGPYW